MKRHGLNFSAYSIPAIIALVLGFINCNQSAGSGDLRSTDVVNITSINSYITEADIKAGVQKTEDKIAAVKLSHIEHEKENVKCVTCHHKVSNDERIKTCAICHKGKAGKDTMHNFCVKCHADKLEGPTTCDDCHL